jgi:protein TonB
VREGEVVEPGPNVAVPSIIHQVEPKYPPMAKRINASGVVEVEVLVGIDGTVEDLRIVNVSRSGVGFENATEEAVRQWRYRPATKNGIKVRMWLKIRVPFRAR